MDTINGWIDDLTKWLKEAFLWLFHGFVDLLKHFVLALGHMLMDGFLYLIGLIPVPQFITDHTMGGMLGQAGPVIGWLGGTLQISTCFGLIGAGYAFRLARKLITLGQW